jgi:hypothetical protein
MRVDRWIGIESVDAHHSTDQHQTVDADHSIDGHQSVDAHLPAGEVAARMPGWK